MGGHGALTIGLRNPDLYQSISAFSPICNPINSPWGQKAFSAYLGENQQDWKNYDSCEILTQLTHHQSILIDQGSNDSFLQDQLKPENLSIIANTKQGEFTLNMRDGYDHSYYFISTYIDSHLQFHAKNLGLIK